MAYFDNAATTYPKPEEVYNFMDSFYRTNGGNAGRGNSKQAISSAALIEDTRLRLQNLFHAPTKQVIFTSTATIALNMIIQGIIKKGCKHVYITPFEHNAVTRTLHSFKDEIEIHVLPCNKKNEYDLDAIKCSFETNKPGMIIASHASNVFGLISPVEQLFSLAKQFNATTVIDMAQTAGLIDINLGLDIFDFAVFAGHKTLYGPTGISGFMMKKDIILPSVLYGGTGYDSQNQDMPSSLPEKYEMGTTNISGIAGLNASLKWIEATGIENIFQKEKENHDKLEELLMRYDFIKIIGKTDAKCVGIISCLIDGISSDSAGNIFAERNISVRTGLQCAPLAHQFMGTFPTGTIRFSCSYFTTDDDFRELDECLSDIEDNL